MLTNLKVEIAHQLAPLVELDAAAVVDLLEVPKDIAHGHLAFPTFPLARTRRQPPPRIASELAAALAAMLNAQQNPLIVSAQAVGGYLNLRFDELYVQNVLAQAALSVPIEKIGASERFRGKTMIIDYGSPNVAKPMHVGHLRATMIGQAIRNLAETQGYQVIGLNHLGDWGVQFGKLAWAYQHWGHEYPFDEDPFGSLSRLYVRFHEVAEKDLTLDRLGSETFLRLENGDPEIAAIWRLFVDITLKEDQRLWDLLKVKHELVRGESFYNNRLEQVENALKAKALLVESEGAQVVRLDELNLPPCLIRKSDGASLYATRDLASAIYRMEEIKADLSLYVVGSAQALHFQQVFAVLRKLGYGWVDRCQHIGFGLVKFAGQQTMSTRKGTVVLLEDVLKQAIARTQAIIEQKNPELENQAEIARMVGVGAVVFNDLVNDRVRDVEFDWEKILDFNGDTGPYVQYCQVRARSLLRKSQLPIEPNLKLALPSIEEQILVRHLLAFGETLEASFNHFKPNILAQYLLELCHGFGHFYQKHRVLGAEPELERARLTLVAIVQRVIEAGLRVLSIESPPAM